MGRQSKRRAEKLKMTFAHAKPFHPAFDFLQRMPMPGLGSGQSFPEAVNLNESPPGYPSACEPFAVGYVELLANRALIRQDPERELRGFERRTIELTFARTLELYEQVTGAAAKPLSTPVICLSPSLANALTLTDLPDTLEGIDFSWKYGYVLVHGNWLGGRFEHYPRWFGFSCRTGDEADAFGEKLMVGGEALLLVDLQCKGVHFVAPSTDCGQMVATCGFRATDDRKDLYIEEPGEGALTPEEEEYAMLLRRLFGNLNAYLSGRPERAESIAIAQPPPPRRNRTDRSIGTRSPLLLELDNAERATYRHVGHHPTSHASPITHWRRGHWRGVPVGKGRTRRRLTWIRPTLVNAAP